MACSRSPVAESSSTFLLCSIELVSTCYYKCAGVSITGHLYPKGKGVRGYCHATHRLRYMTSYKQTDNLRASHWALAFYYRLALLASTYSTLNAGLPRPFCTSSLLISYYPYLVSSPARGSRLVGHIYTWEVVSPLAGNNQRSKDRAGWEQLGGIASAEFPRILRESRIKVCPWIWLSAAAIYQ